MDWVGALGVKLALALPTEAFTSASTVQTLGCPPGKNGERLQKLWDSCIIVAGWPTSLQHVCESLEVWRTFLPMLGILLSPPRWCSFEKDDFSLRAGMSILPRVCANEVGTLWISSVPGLFR